MATRTVLEGTAQDDTFTLTGETIPYEIRGYAGNDVIYGGAGADWIDAGSGHDHVDAGAGADTVVAGSGIDKMHGGAGTDLLLGSDQDDQVHILAWSGFEVVDLGAGSDALVGGSSNDRWDLSGITLIGVELIDLGSGWNRLIGSAGDDVITAGKQGDIIDGGGGDDSFLYNGLYADFTISGAPGALTISGAYGTDRLTNVENVVFNDGVWRDGVFTANDGSGGGGGEPVNQAPVANDDSYSTAYGTAVVLAPLANDSDPDGDTLSIGTIGPAANGSLSFADGQWTYTPDAGFSGTDSFTYTASDGTLEASATITVSVAPDGSGGGGTATVIEGTNNDDRVDVSADTAPYDIRTYGGNDVIYGGAGSDWIDAGSGHDHVDAGGGDDTVVTGTGTDQIHGGAGTDLLLGSDQDDEVRVLSFSGFEFIDLGAGNDALVAGSGNDRWDLSGTTLIGVELIDLGSGWNRLTGSAGDDVITAGKQGDVIDGGGGDDTFIVNGLYADFTLSGAPGALTISGAYGTDRLTNIENVVFNDGVWRDGVFTANDGSGGGGGGGGGGEPVNQAPVANNDSYSTAFGTTVVLAPLVNDSDPDGDTLSIRAIGPAVSGSLSLVNGQWTYTPNAGFSGTDSFSYTATDGALDDTATITVNVTPDETGGGGGTATVIEGTAGDDRIDVSADTAAYEISTYGGNDVIYGSAGSDWIDPGSGHDYVNAGGGNDTVVAGTGTDELHGGAGTDLLLGSDRDDQVSVLSFSGFEVIDLGAGRDALVAGSGNDRWDFSGTALIGVELINLGAGWNRLTGSAGNDVITAGKQGDIIDGGGGDDSFLYNGLYADFTISGAPGALTVSGAYGTDNLTNVEAVVFNDGVWRDGVFTPDDGSGGGGGGGATFWERILGTPEGGWTMLNNNKFMDAIPGASDAAESGTPKGVIVAWSSMAWDPHRGDLIVWGGGHANYSGNEVYRFDTDTLLWERGSLPSRVVESANPLHDVTVDGPFNSPISSHTYDNSEFLPIADRFVTFGGAAFNSGTSFMVVDDDGVARRTGPYFWDPSKADPDKVGGLDGSGTDPSRLGGQMWENRDAIYDPDVSLANFINGASDYVEENGKDVIYIANRPLGGLFKYTVHDVNDAALDTWEQVGRGWSGFDGKGTGAFDPVLNVFVRSAESAFTYWDLDAAGPLNDNVMFTPQDLSGGFSMDGYTAMDYDPKRGQFLLWDGNDDVWALDAPDVLGPDGWTVERVAGAASPSPAVPDVGSTSDGFAGVLGKWKYIEDLDIFLGIYDTESVWAYKPHDWDPTVMA